MKLLKIIGHPVAIISVFLLVMISGESFGVPYLLYLILALPHGGSYALLAVGGILLLSFSSNREVKWRILNPVLRLVGILLLILSLYVFFQCSRGHYNANTFEQTVPILSLVVLSIFMFSGIIVNILQLLNRNDHNTELVKT